MSRVEQRIEETPYGHEVNPLSVTGYVEAPLAYDAVWALALALNSSQARYIISSSLMIFLTVIVIISLKALGPCKPRNLIENHISSH